MSNKRLILIVLALTLGACAHREALRVDCDGPLRPINRPAVAGKSTSPPDAKATYGNSESPHGQ